MKPGEFVGVDGTIYSVVGCRVHVTKFGFKTIDPDHSDFPAAFAALQSLIRPSLDPRSGRVLAMREGGDFEWDGLCSPIYRHRLHEGRVQFFSKCDDRWLDSDDDQFAAFEAGRRYERERG